MYAAILPSARSVPRRCRRLLCLVRQGRQPRKPTFAVSGKVLDGTKPLANVAVVFHPVGDDGPKPRGKTDADGAFSLTTYDTADGAPAGEYRVTLELWLAGRPDEGP